MVVFSCDACGDSLRKKDVQKHYQFNCRRCESLTCVDCKKQFWGDEYAVHSQCVTDEDFKYGLVAEHKDDKGLRKQNLWISTMKELVSDPKTNKKFIPALTEMLKYENVPRKKKPFTNWCKCTMKRFPFHIVEEVFDLVVEVHAQKLQSQDGGSQNKGGTNSSNGENVEVTPEAEGKESVICDEAEKTEKKISKKKRKSHKIEEREEEQEEVPRKKKKSKVKSTE